MPEADQVIAQVSVAPISWSDADGKYNVPQQDGRALFQDYYIQNRYEQDGHTYMIPVSSPTGFGAAKAKVAFVQLAAPSVIWICDWTAEKSLEKPTIPNPISQDPNWFLLDQHLEPFMTKVEADGNTITYRISGTYFYGCLNPNPEFILNAKFPQPPWFTDNGDRTLKTDLYQTDISQPMGTNRVLRTQ